MRETFSKKLAEIPVKKSGSSDEEEDEVCDWPYFSQLQFLRDQFTPRQTSGNYPTTDEAQLSAVNEHDGDDNSIIQTVDSPRDSSVHSCSQFSAQSSPAPLSDSAPVRKRKQTDDKTVACALLKAEQEKLEYLKRKEENRIARRQEPVDEDMAFFTSLLPHIRILSPRKKMRIRVQMMQLVEAAMDNESVSTNIAGYSTETPATVVATQSVNSAPMSSTQYASNIQSDQWIFPSFSSQDGRHQ